MEKLTHCPLCDNKLKSNQIGLGASCFLASVDNLVTGNRFIIEQCNSCSFLFTNPRPDKSHIRSYYHSESYISHTETKQTIKDKLYFLVQKIMLGRKIRLLKKHTKEKNVKLLDYGCGTGNFLNEAVKNGFKSIGFEPEPVAREKGLKKKLTIFSTHGQVIGHNTVKLDVITLWHVLEHLHTFPVILDEFYTNLNPGGLLILALPMADSTDAILYKKHWAGWDLPRHLFHFTRETTGLACEKAGFKLLERKAMPFDSYYVAWLSEYQKKSRLAPVKAFFAGSYSNLNAAFGKTPWSSEIFIFKKQG